MADEPPSLMTWARSQMRRKPAGDDTPGTGGGFRLSRGLMIAIVLSCVVVVLVLTSDNGGTPTTTTAESASPGASPAPGDPPPPSGEPAAAPPPGDATPAATSKPPVAAGNSDRSTPVGTTAYTRDRQSLTVRTEPNNGSGVVATLGYDTPLTLVCHTEGPVVYGMNALRSSLWVKVTTPGGNTGYVPDAWIATAAEVPTLVPAC
ncbi:SH3 domain-containing protein [Yinghuangia sp. ASG 101]|uniref:SH3 domain-containing protein n=1 Tax=Yinghuangia sp. ASG 101 TaxID=2896848 RepID=UPI001E3E2F20|nr:SH3 domain-containing protein [Yinghuangia sp. ASG 101]UGQ14237.1 SH3 domain-containing protein [Yinghuangia sp. ASG 101]